ncbi:hypothetical protein KIPB_013063 [Kipferlia bialata]|uniref:Uncharacterized protein n=1 Tax=Kipferlia bialata TaxID=797122 RepID=A0A9K3GNG1_9EUKA|nr:hypothetical protein KIPB_013063 [Kipferlia bialata]|eukprot:g13063.t1
MSSPRSYGSGSPYGSPRAGYPSLSPRASFGRSPQFPLPGDRVREPVSSTLRTGGAGGYSSSPAGLSSSGYASGYARSAVSPTSASVGAGGSYAAQRRMVSPGVGSRSMVRPSSAAPSRSPTYARQRYI